MTNLTVVVGHFRLHKCLKSGPNKLVNAKSTKKKFELLNAANSQHYLVVLFIEDQFSIIQLSRLSNTQITLQRISKKKTFQTNGQTNERTNGVTWSLLELLIEAKNQIQVIMI